MQAAVHILADDSSKLSSLRVMLEKTFRVTGALLTRASGACGPGAVVVAADLRAAANITALKQSFAHARLPHKRVFVMDRRERLLVLQAHALGATGVLYSPVVAGELCRSLQDDPAGTDTSDINDTRVVATASAGAAAMSAMFSAVLGNRPIDVEATISAARNIAESVTANGLSAWMNAVRQHHEGTYQHCLLVMGVVVDFGRRLGFAEPDMQRLYSAAMFHDIGKAAIPAAILDKPGRLDIDDRKLMETHPVAGYDYLLGGRGIAPEVLDVVRHHHEYLDGSGYPDGLAAHDISDVVRIVTISDIFAALIERRSYKPPLSRSQAYDILLGMRGKLEAPLLQAFRDVALHR